LGRRSRDEKVLLRFILYRLVLRACPEGFAVNPIKKSEVMKKLNPERR
jgi:hypothetical protein